jgi:hypothetical protein
LDLTLPWIFYLFLEIDHPVEWRRIGTPRAVGLGARPSIFDTLDEPIHLLHFHAQDLGKMMDVQVPFGRNKSLHPLG